MSSCGMRQAQVGDITSETQRKKKKLDFGDYIKGIILGIMESERDEQYRMPGSSTNTPDPRLPPE